MPPKSKRKKIQLEEAIAAKISEKNFQFLNFHIYLSIHLFLKRLCIFVVLRLVLLKYFFYNLYTKGY